MIIRDKYLQRLSEKVLVFDGAMGTSLQAQNLTEDRFGGSTTAGCNDYLVLSYPQAIEKVHRSFLESGADVIESCTFRANRLTLAEYGLADKTLLINQTAAALARRLADEYSTPDFPRLVAGSIGPSGKLPSMNDPELSNITFTELTNIFCEQAQGLLSGGADVILIETSQDILEVKACIHGIRKAMQQTEIQVPIQAQITLDTTGKMLLGTDIETALTILEGMGIDAIGLNCSTGPDYMREPIRYLGEHSTLPVSCIPNAGLPLNIDGQAVYPLEAESFAKELLHFVKDFHINIVGGCCGTTPEHIRLLAELLKDQPQNPRPAVREARLASGIESVPMRQTPPPFLIGERLNTQGSAKFKKIMLAEDYEGALAIARQQMENGAHGLDLCVALTERTDEAAAMKKLIKTLAPSIRLPFIIDTTEPDVLETALQNAPGRCLINSTNLEAGPSKLDRVLSLAKKYNAAVIALTIDEKGMAKTAERKLEIARRISQIATQEFHLRPGDLVFDTLTFTMATGDPEYANSAVETIEAIRSIKHELPGVLTSLGVSNVSFGFDSALRPIINSIMLYHCVEAGLDMAIVNPAQIQAYSDIDPTIRILTENLLFNRSADALQQLIDHFSDKKPEAKTKINDLEQQLMAMPPDQRLYTCILNRIKEPVADAIDALIMSAPPAEQHQTAIHILNNILLSAMKETGDRFGKGELILPFVLQSAEVMKQAVNHLEQYLEKQEGSSKGKLVLATVYGDVHDIGKNLVKTIFSNNGFDVIDLGKQVPAETIITQAIEQKANAIGLSALLVSTSKQMPLIVNELQRRNLNIPLLIGGAAINPLFSRSILKTENGAIFEGGVFYCKDAFEGLQVMEQLSNPDRRKELIHQVTLEAQMDAKPETTSPKTISVSLKSSSIPPADMIPSPPFWGARFVESMPLDRVFQHISKSELYRLSWGAKNTRGDDWVKLKKEFDQKLEEMHHEALTTPWLFPQGVYGYWPVQSTADELIIYDPNTITSGSPVEILRFHFPRQKQENGLSLTDYFSKTGSEKMDVAAFQVVTVGQQASQISENLMKDDRYSEFYFRHGLSVQTAEATADYLHEHIRRELGLKPDQGKRYSWGYSVIPDLSEHQKVFSLLHVQEKLGIHLTSAWQMVPEQSTAALIVHHPLAKFFTIEK